MVTLVELNAVSAQTLLSALLVTILAVQVTHDIAFEICAEQVKKTFQLGQKKH